MPDGAEGKSRRWEEEKVVVEMEKLWRSRGGDGKGRRWSRRCCGEGRRKFMSGGGGREGRKDNERGENRRREEEGES